MVPLGMCGALLVVPFVTLRPSRAAVPASTASARTPVSHETGATNATRPGGGKVSFLAWVDAAAPAAVLVASDTVSPAPSGGLVTPTTTSAVAPEAATAGLVYPPAPTHTETGPASWYGARVGSCAHPYLAFGTTVQITNLKNGRQAQCVVDDRGPYIPGRVIDLSKSVFAELAPTTLGVIEVRLSW